MTTIKKVKSMLRNLVVLGLVATSCAPIAIAGPQQQFFNYQGQLQENGLPVSGNYNLAFELYDDATAGNLVSEVNASNWPVTGGLFSVSLNFGDATFTGTQYWLQVYINTVPMLPRTTVRVSPVAEYALTAGSVPNGAITTSALATSSVTLAKIAGASSAFTGSLTLHAGNCGVIAGTVTGAKVGDLAIVGFGGGFAPPVGIVIGPASVTAANTVKANVCNNSATNYSSSSVSYVFRTFR